MKMRWKIQWTTLVLFLSILVVAASKSQDDDLSSEARIIRKLTSIPNYEKRVRPIRNSSNTMYIGISFYPRSLVNLDDEMQRIAMAAYFDLYWKDEYIKWDPKEYGGVKTIVLTDKDIWKPDVITADSQGGINDVAYVFGQIDLVVGYDGNVTWYSNRVFVRSCNLDMTYFPFDQQECFYRFESRTQNRKSLTMAVVIQPDQTDTIDLTELKSSRDGQWDFIKADAGIFVEQYLDWSYYKVTILIQRKPTYFLMNVLGPCIVISFLIPIMFYLPPGSGEKISMGVTILLAFSVFQMVIAEVLPHTSDTTPLIVIYIMALMTTSAVSIILTVVVLHCHLRQDGGMSNWQRVVIFEMLGRILFMHDTAKQEISKHTDTPHIYENHAFSTREELDIQQNGVQLKAVTNKIDATPGHHPLAPHTNGISSSAGELENTLGLLKEVLDSLKEYIKIRMKKVIQQNKKDQWIEAARILDRLFMLIYIVINIVAATVFFGIFASRSNKMMK